MKDGNQICYGVLGCFDPVKFMDITPIMTFPYDPDTINATFSLFTKDNPFKPINFDHRLDKNRVLSSTFDANKRTKFIVHGFTESYAAAKWMEVKLIFHVLF